MSPLHVQSPESEFNALAALGVAAFAVALFKLLKAIFKKSATARAVAREGVARHIGQTMTMADMIGRKRALREFDAALSTMKAKELPIIKAMMPEAPKILPKSLPSPVASLPITGKRSVRTPMVPKVTFKEAFNDLLTREPRLADSAEEVADLYQNTHAFALAKSAEESLTAAVQRKIAASVETGESAASVSKNIQEMGDFTRSYANTVYRTNLNTAYTAGRFQQAQEPGVRTVLPAMERWSVRDSSLRAGRHQDGGENHAAAHGLVAATTDRIWQTLSPPSGYGCRCGVRLVSVSELRKRGLLDANGAVIRYEPPGFGKFRAHANFGRRRPDLLVYGGGSLT